MARGKLRIPTRLAAVAIGVALAGCPSSDPSHHSQQALCPEDYYCNSDAARAFNCTDGSSDPFHSDLGECYPPV